MENSNISVPPSGDVWWECLDDKKKQYCFVLAKSWFDAKSMASVVLHSDGLECSMYDDADLSKGVAAVDWCIELEYRGSWKKDASSGEIVDIEEVRKNYL